MRDESLDVEYKPSEIGDYYEENLKEAQENYNKFKEMSDDDILKIALQEFEESKEYHIKEIEEKKSQREKLESILKATQEFNPPTVKHVEFKKFMIQQIVDTIKWDCDISYHEDELNKLEKNNIIINAQEIREEHLKSCEKDIEYYSKHKDSEEKNCKEANEWIQELFKALDK
jgi:hypothetical protein